MLFGNLRRWKQLGEGDVLFKGISQGNSVTNLKQLRAYHFPLGPRIYRTSLLKKYGGFPVVAYEDGRMYEDVSLLNRLIQKSRFCFRDFTVYNVREHAASITRQNQTKWNAFIHSLDMDEIN
ncbi:hypothetical protein RWE15_01080 [Virgibacillus halophilus]|uniref:Uncharacterized protein n=1 Tax=Tigheibacillus halophilus TaxID=361280 RepID=A0ABU5C3H8_9BACI|nr:hypothetical protein [Virgibacillus halophilus]